MSIQFLHVFLIVGFVAAVDVKDQVFRFAFRAQNSSDRIDEIVGGENGFHFAIGYVVAEQIAGGNVGAENIAGTVNHQNRIGRGIEDGGVGYCLRFQLFRLFGPKTVHFVNGGYNLPGIAFGKVKILIGNVFLLWRGEKCTCGSVAIQK